jgi:murein tripeptide amidase MpaA
LESIGKTHENRDIFMIKVEADEIADPGSRKKAILMTGAHHSRELVSVQMPLFMLLDLLHGFVHNDPEKMLLLAKNKYFIIPMVNVDGSFTIYDQYEKTGELVLKRKNNDRRFEG